MVLLWQRSKQSAPSPPPVLQILRPLCRENIPFPCFSFLRHVELFLEFLFLASLSTLSILYCSTLFSLSNILNMPTYPAQLICRPANLFSAPSNLLEKDSALFSIAETICEESSLSCIKSCSAALLVSHLIYQSSPTQDLQEWIQFPLLEAAGLLGWCWKFVFKHDENRSPAYPVLKCHLSNHKKFPKESQQSSQRAVTACSDCLSLP